MTSDVTMTSNDAAPNGMVPSALVGTKWRVGNLAAAFRTAFSDKSTPHDPESSATRSDRAASTTPSPHPNSRTLTPLDSCRASHFTRLRNVASNAGSATVGSLRLYSSKYALKSRIVCHSVDSFHRSPLGAASSTRYSTSTRPSLIAGITSRHRAPLLTPRVYLFEGLKGSCVVPLPPCA